MSRNQVFISYSHADSEWRERLRVRIQPFIIRENLRIWSDRDIEAGDRWQESIDEAIRTACVAVLLVSPDFIASDFITNQELPPLLQSAEQEELKLIWVPIRDASYGRTAFCKYQAGYNPKTPI